MSDGHAFRGRRRAGGELDERNVVDRYERSIERAAIFVSIKIGVGNYLEAAVSCSQFVQSRSELRRRHNGARARSANNRRRRLQIGAEAGNDCRWIERRGDETGQRRTE